MFSSVKSGTVILLVLVLVAVPQINGWDFYDTTHGTELGRNYLLNRFRDVKGFLSRV